MRRVPCADSLGLLRQPSDDAAQEATRSGPGSTRRACPACALCSGNPRCRNPGHQGYRQVHIASRRRPGQMGKAGSLRRTARHRSSTPSLAGVDQRAHRTFGFRDTALAGSWARTREHTPRFLRRTGYSAGPPGTLAPRMWAGRPVRESCPRRRSRWDRTPQHLGDMVVRTSRPGRHIAARGRRLIPYTLEAGRSARLPGAGPQGRRRAPMDRRPRWRGCGRADPPGTVRPSCTGCPCSTAFFSEPPSGSRGEARIPSSARTCGRTSLAEHAPRS
jgi:hypothetical protein